ncbi:hypothetical protein CJ030_MR6G025438 [Morella rubra]|uniref:Uncharacterized protein n=1 Tax=Morella rubra TaxID=262757 RepID=A0A6A1VCD1_9ROSI|nr:hypothetical protein CJ030_MR6G025438 [Morella rubra]
MDRSTRITLLFIFCFVFLSLQILSTIGVEEHYAQNREATPSGAKIVTDAISGLKQSHQRSLNRIRSIIKEFRFSLSSPNLDFGGTDDAKSANGVGGDGAKGKMKEAAQESLKTSKNAVEESTESAAKVVGGAMHKTTEKVKESVSEKDEF